MSGQAALVVGVGVTEATSPSRQGRSALELCQLAVHRALDHAGLDPGRIDAVVTGNIDGFEGTVLGAKHVTRLLGIPPDVPCTVVNTGGTTGGNLMQVAARMVRSRGHRTVLCLGGPTFYGARDLQTAINTNSPMIIEQPLGMGGFHMGAFAANAYLHRHGLDARDLAAVVVADHEKAARNPYAHLRYPLTVDDVVSARPLSAPLTQPMVCPVSTQAVAMLVGDPQTAREARPDSARIDAMGTSSDPYLGGGKGDFARMLNLELLARRVYDRAAVRDPVAELSVAEVFAPYAHMQPMQLEALGLAAPGAGIDLIRSGITAHDGALPVNPSGGPKCTNAGVAGELAPYAYAALQVMHEAPEAIQVADAETALAHGTGGTFFQFENLAVLRRVAKESR